MELNSFRIINRESKEGERTVYLAQSDTCDLYHLFVLSADPSKLKFELADMHEVEISGIEVEAKIIEDTLKDPEPELLIPIKFIAGEEIKVLYMYGYTKRIFTETEAQRLKDNCGESILHGDV